MSRVLVIVLYGSYKAACRNRPQLPHSSSFQICSVQYLYSYLSFCSSSHRLSTRAIVHATPCLSRTLSTRDAAWTPPFFALIMRDNAVPLLTFEPGSLPPIRGYPLDDHDSDDERLGNPRRWYHYIPLCCESSHRVHLHQVFLPPLLTSTRSQSRGPAPSSTASVHPIRPAQLPLSNPTRAALLHRAPPHHLHLLLPRLQLAHRLRRA